MSRIGLVLGGGGITGAAYEMAALMAIRLATGWSPNDAEVVVGTSAGAFVSALVRSDALGLDSLVLPTDDREQVAERIRQRLYTRNPGGNVASWVRHGVARSIRQPGLTLAMGAPARFDTTGLAAWVEEQIGADAARSWPSRPTAIVSYDIVRRRRVAFGTESAPEIGLAAAVAASSSIPVLFRPFQLDGHLLVDGGVISGTNADLVLGVGSPLDLILILAPMAVIERRPGAWAHERLLDRVGRNSMATELEAIATAWPETDTVVLTPSPQVQDAMRPNPMEVRAAVPTFIKTLNTMKRTLARPGVWEVLSRHLPRARV